jgi:hypothetical protein
VHAEELGVREQQVAAAISLLDGGATVPFVARYRKEATGALDDAQLRTLDDLRKMLREDRRREWPLSASGPIPIPALHSDTGASGTGSSNPACSSGESAANLTREPSCRRWEKIG